MSDYSTARDLEVSSKASGKGLKKVYWCSEYHEPVQVISGMSFSTGKHGSGKTRLNCVGYFTNKKVSLLLKSSEPFYDLAQNPDYTFYQMVSITVDKPNEEATFLKNDNGTFTTIVIPLDEEVEVKEGESYRVHAFYDKLSFKTYYKLGA